MPRYEPPTVNHLERMRKLADKRREILAGFPEKAVAAILDHPQPAALVHSFPEEDLHFLIHDIGPLDALPLIALASNRQWEYLLDIETWHQDHLDFAQTTQWLQLMLQADPDRLVQWCFEEKLEFLEFYLFRNIELQIRESDQAPSDFGEGFFTDDDTFYVRFVDYPVTTPEEEAIIKSRNDMLSSFLRHLSRFDHPRYQGLLMEAISVIPAETEEELFRLRNVRLGEKGFLPFDEAIGVYQPMRPEEVSARGRKVISLSPENAGYYPVPQFTSTFMGKDNLFVRSLKGIQEPHILQQLQMELAGLCNQIISADQIPIRSRSQLHAVVSKVSSYLSIGLERLTKGIYKNGETGTSPLLVRHFLGDIFRTGFGEAMQLKWQASRWRKESWFQEKQMDLTFWEEKWLGLLGGLLIDTPKYYDPSNPASKYRNFQSQKEIHSTRKGLEQVMAMDHVLKRINPPHKPATGSRLLTYKNLILTFWAQSSLQLPSADENPPVLSLPISDFRDFYSTLWTDRKGRRFISDEKKSEFLAWVSETSKEPQEILSDRLGAVFEALFNDVEKELAPVKTGNLDPRYIHLFLLTP